MAARLRNIKVRPKTGPHSRAALKRKYFLQEKRRAARVEKAEAMNRALHWPLPKGYMPKEILT